MVELKTRFEGLGFKGCTSRFRVENSGVFSFPVGELGLEKIDTATIAWLLLKHPRLLGADMMILKNPKLVIQTG